MFEFYYQQGRKRRKLQRVRTDSCGIGSARDNDLVIDKRGVAKRHTELFKSRGQVFVRDLGSGSGTWVNRQRVREYGPLTELDEVIVGDVHITLHRVLTDTPPSNQKPVDAMSRKKPVSPKTLGHVDDASTSLFENEPHMNGEPGLSAVFIEPVSSHKENANNKEISLESKSMEHGISDLSTGDSSVSGDRKQLAVVDQPDQSELLYWSKILHDQVLADMDLRRKDVSRMSDQQLREETADLIDNALQGLLAQIPTDLDLNMLRRNVLDEAVGLGPLEAFLNDESITEIMVNNHREIFVEKAGKLQKSQFSFSSNDAVYAVIERIITPIGRRIDESSPIVDARLKDGSRVNAVIPPLALKGPSLTVRKFPNRRLKFEDLISCGSVDQNTVRFLQVCVEMHKNIIVSGGTGSGKTTLLNVLSNFIPDQDRIVTIEDAAELKLVQPNLVSLESRPPNLEGRGAITIRDLVKNALRMRPDRIVVGECRGGEAIDMLQAMNTGHDGSLTTIHANNPRDVISRLEVLVLMAGMDLPVTAIREQVSSAVDMIIQQTRFPCGSRKITRVTEVVGIESGTVQLQDIFRFRQTGRDKEGRVAGHFAPTGFIPSFYEELAELGHELDMGIFSNQNDSTEFDHFATNSFFPDADTNADQPLHGNGSFDTSVECKQVDHSGVDSTLELAKTPCDMDQADENEVSPGSKHV